MSFGGCVEMWWMNGPLDKTVCYNVDSVIHVVVLFLAVILH